MIQIDGVGYQVGIISLKRSIKKEYKYNVISEDGTRHFEMQALYRVYTVALGNMDAAEYDALYKAVSESAGAVSLVMPDGQTDINMTATLENISDGLEFIGSDGSRLFSGLSFTATDVNPLEVS